MIKPRKSIVFLRFFVNILLFLHELRAQILTNDQLLDRRREQAPALRIEFFVWRTALPRENYRLERSDRDHEVSANKDWSLSVFACGLNTRILQAEPQILNFWIGGWNRPPPYKFCITPRTTLVGKKAKPRSSPRPPNRVRRLDSQIKSVILSGA